MNQTKITLAAAILFSTALAGGSLVRAQTTPGTGGTLPSATPSASPSPNSSSLPGVLPASPLELLNRTLILNYLHYSNTVEITEATTALAQLTNSAAISFANTMVTDHQQNEQQVTQLASQKSVTLYPFQESTVETAADTELNRLAGADYDLAYLTLQSAEHRTVLQNLLIKQGQTTDPDLLNLINLTIPVIQRHISLANSALSSLNTGTPAPSPSPSSSASPTPSPTATPSPITTLSAVLFH